MGFRRNEVNRNDVTLADGIFYAGGHLHVNDDLGSYSIPVGRKARRELAVLDENPGVWKRYLQIDLLTGFVYYCVDNFTDGGKVYYYDIPSKKIWNERVRRLLHFIKNEKFRPTKEELQVYRQLPCDNWIELMSTLPKWKEVLEHRMDDLLLPQGEVDVVSAARVKEEFAGEETEGCLTGAILQANFEAGKNVQIGFPSRDKGFSSRGRDSRTKLILKQKEGRTILEYADVSAGAEFFGDDSQYQRFLTEDELSAVLQIVSSARRVEEESAVDAESGSDGENDSDEGLTGVRSRSRKLAQEAAAHESWEIPEGETGEKAEEMLMGFLRREVEFK